MDWETGSDNVPRCNKSSEGENSYSDVDVQQGSVLSPLFIIVLEALSWEIHTGFPYELLYAYDLVNLAETMDELLNKLKRW